MSANTSVKCLLCGVTKQRASYGAKCTHGKHQWPTIEGEIAKAINAVLDRIESKGTHDNIANDPAWGMFEEITRLREEYKLTDKE